MNLVSQTDAFWYTRKGVLLGKTQSDKLWYQTYATSKSDIVAVAYDKSWGAQDGERIDQSKLPAFVQDLDAALLVLESLPD